MKIFLIVISFLIIQTVKSQDEKFKPDDLGIIVEDFDSTNMDVNRYNVDNYIYKPDKKIYFNYYYLDTNNVKYLMTKDSSKDWFLDRLDNRNPNSVCQIIMTVTYGLGPFQNWKDYNQTVIMYDYRMFNGTFWPNEMTGLIENKKNIWIHPPRTDLFMILEINPYPFIKQPYDVGHKWDWILEFGDHWSDKRWLKWDGRKVNKCHYEINRKVDIDSKLGKIDCFEVIGSAVCELGKTKLISYFNNDYGFVKLDYTNIDKSKIIIEIDRIE